jgi:ADP-ribose pyrophosphatase YjhB (NUDIX family)
MRKLVRSVWQILPTSVRLRLTRLLQPTFTVSVAAVVLNDDREVLLLDHVLRPGASWGLPGGFIDKGEQPVDAISRELREETGIALKDVRMLEMRVMGRHVEILFAAQGVGEPEVKSREILSFGWYAGDDMPERFPHGQRLIIGRVLRGEV